MVFGGCRRSVRLGRSGNEMVGIRFASVVNWVMEVALESLEDALMRISRLLKRFSNWSRRITRLAIR